MFTSAEWFKSTLQVSTLPFSALQMSGVFWSCQASSQLILFLRALEVHFIYLALFCHSKMNDFLSVVLARFTYVFQEPTLSVALTLAPFSISSQQVAVWPFSALQMSGVFWSCRHIHDWSVLDKSISITVETYMSELNLTSPSALCFDHNEKNI